MGYKSTLCNIINCAKRDQFFFSRKKCILVICVVCVYPYGILLILVTYLTVLSIPMSYVKFYYFSGNYAFSGKFSYCLESIGLKNKLKLEIFLNSMSDPEDFYL